MLLPETLRRQPQWLVLIEALVLVGLIGWFDYVTGWEWSFFAPYAVPIVLVVWRTGRRLGFVFATLCAATFWVSHIGGNPYQTDWGFGLAVGGWWFYFSVLVVAVVALKAKRAHPNNTKGRASPGLFPNPRAAAREHELAPRSACTSAGHGPGLSNELPGPPDRHEWQQVPGRRELMSARSHLRREMAFRIPRLS